MFTNDLSTELGEDEVMFFDSNPVLYAGGAYANGGTPVALPPILTVNRGGAQTYANNPPASALNFAATTTTQGDGTTGHSTRDAVVGLVQQGLSLLPVLFGRNQQGQVIATPVNPGAVPGAGAGLNLGVSPSGLNLGGGLQLNMTTILIVGLAAALLLKK
jgi:hypothetical protein